MSIDSTEVSHDSQQCKHVTCHPTVKTCHISPTALTCHMPKEKYMSHHMSAESADMADMCHVCTGCWYVTCLYCRLTCDMSKLSADMWHVTRDIWYERDHPVSPRVLCFVKKFWPLLSLLLKKTVLIIAFRIALTLNVQIVWFGRQMAVCVRKRHKNAIFECSRF